MPPNFENAQFGDYLSSLEEKMLAVHILTTFLPHASYLKTLFLHMRSNNVIHMLIIGGP